ncbi:MAG: TonB-dependent receptor, partial [Muribaculaceae bacterium]|nr:TonB-dependent receptor [Muribaculaceae bacterium]
GIILILPIYVFGNTIFKGRVCFPDSLSYPYSISLYKDSTLLRTHHFTTECYSFSTKKDVTFLKFTSLGFSSVEVPIGISTCDSIVIPSIKFREDAQQLGEVVVTARKAIVKNVGMNYTISNIRGSYIGNAGSLMDMLSWTPGISVLNNETINVLGRGGAPLIYINGVRVMNKSVLYTLTSSNVDKIEIIREPGAEYPIGTSSVILITTGKSIGDMVNGEIYNGASFRNSFSDQIRGTTFGKIKRVSFNASVSYNLVQNKQSANYGYDVFSPTGENNNSQKFNQNSHVKNHSLNWFIGANYVARNKSRYLLQYAGSSADNRISNNTYRTLANSSFSLTDRYSSKSNGTPILHSVLGYGMFNLYGGVLKLTGTFNHRNNCTNENYDWDNNDLNTSSLYNYRYNMVTIQGDYSHKFWIDGKHTYGFYLGYSENFMHLNNAGNQKEQNVSGNNKWAEVYYSFNKKYKKFTVQSGMRGRYEFDSNNENNTEKKHLSYVSVSPRISMNYMFSDDYIVSASYALTSGLPTFRQLSPAIRLSNLIFYSQGNPSLKQSFTNRFNITANIINVTLITEYYDNHNSIINITEPYADGTFITRPENMKKSSDLLLAAEYSFMPNSKFRVYTRIMGIRSQFQYTYKFEPVISKDYSLELDVNAAYKIKKFSIFINGFYHTPKKVDTRMLSYQLSLNVGADYSFLKNKLYVRLEAQDLFRRSVTPFWKEYSPNLYQYRRNKYDTRGLFVSLRYKFTTAKTGFMQQRQTQDASRLD